MELWVISLIVLGAGAAGGIINALLSDNAFVVPKFEHGLVRPGFIGNVLIGAAASFVSWGLYGQYAGFPVVGSTGASAQEYSETLSAVTGAFLVGIAGSRYLTNEVDKKLLRRAASKAAVRHADAEMAAEIATSTPAEALRLMS